MHRKLAERADEGQRPGTLVLSTWKEAEQNISPQTSGQFYWNQ